MTNNLFFTPPPVGRLSTRSQANRFESHPVDQATAVAAQAIQETCKVFSLVDTSTWRFDPYRATVLRNTALQHPPAAGEREPPLDRVTLPVQFANMRREEPGEVCVVGHRYRQRGGRGHRGRPNGNATPLAPVAATSAQPVNGERTDLGAAVVFANYMRVGTEDYPYVMTQFVGNEATPAQSMGIGPSVAIFGSDCAAACAKARAPELPPEQLAERTQIEYERLNYYSRWSRKIAEHCVDAETGNSVSIFDVWERMQQELGAEVPEERILCCITFLNQMILKITKFNSIEKALILSDEGKQLFEKISSVVQTILDSEEGSQLGPYTVRLWYGRSWRFDEVYFQYSQTSGRDAEACDTESRWQAAVSHAEKTQTSIHPECIINYLERLVKDKNTQDVAEILHSYQQSIDLSESRGSREVRSFIKEQNNRERGYFRRTLLGRFCRKDVPPEIIEFFNRR